MPLKFSIILPVYNTESFLEQAINSVLVQTVTNWEIIAVDDASTDSSLNILTRYSKNDERIKILALSQNQGLGSVRNLAMSQATGDYLVFLDSDDFLADNALSLLLMAMESCSEADVFLWGFSTYVNEKIVKSFLPVEPDAEKDETSFELGLLSRKGVVPFAWAYAIKRSLVEKYNIQFAENIFFEDIIFNTKLLFHALKIQIIPKSCYYYRRHSGSITGTFSKQKIDDKFTAFTSIKSFLHEKGLFAQYQSHFLARFLTLCVHTCFNEYFMLPKNERDDELDDYMKKIRTSKLLRKENLLMIKNISLAMPQGEKSAKKSYMTAYYGLSAINKRYRLHRFMVRAFGYIYRTRNKLR